MESSKIMEMAAVTEARRKSSNYTAKKFACFTGHRPNKLHGYDRNAYRPLVSQLTGRCEEILRKYNLDGFISGGAQGFDQLAFWSVKHVIDQSNLIENLVYIPFVGQSDIWSPTGAFSQQDYDQMLLASTGVKIIAPEKPADKRGIVQALHARNHAMVDDSDLVIALWAEPTGAGKGFMHSSGGTAECIRYAVSQYKQVIILYYNREWNLIDGVEELN